jgi:hypothetical protein
MGSSKVADNAAIWAVAIRNRSTDEDVLWLAEHAVKEIESMAEGRNDFIHAVFQAEYMSPATQFLGYMSPATQFLGGGGMLSSGLRHVDTTARRVRRDKHRSV